MIQNFVLNHSFFGVGSVIESTPHFFTRVYGPGLGACVLPPSPVLWQHKCWDSTITFGVVFETFWLETALKIDLDFYNKIFLYQWLQQHCFSSLWWSSSSLSPLWSSSSFSSSSSSSSSSWRVIIMNHHHHHDASSSWTIIIIFIFIISVIIIIIIINHPPHHHHRQSSSSSSSASSSLSSSSSSSLSPWQSFKHDNVVRGVKGRGQGGSKIQSGKEKDRWIE